jgi:transcriptional regulator with XRE-family HTH domain
VSRFSDLFREVLDRKGLTVRAAADLLGVSHGFVGLLTNQRRTPPLDQVPQWADRLGLHGDERRLFIDYAALAHLPDSVREQFEAWYDNHHQLRQDYQELLTEVRALKRAAER